MDDPELLDPHPGPEAAAHRESCADCRARLAEYRRIEAALAALPLRVPANGLEARIRARVEAAERRRAAGLTVIPGGAGRPRRRLPSEGVLLILGLAAALLLFVIAGGVRVGSRPTTLWTLTGAGAAAIAVAACGFALRYPRDVEGRSETSLAAVIIGVPLLLFSWKVGVSGTFAGAMAAWASRPVTRCLGLALAIGGAPWVGLLLGRRARGARLAGWDGLLCGVAAGAVGWASIDLWCPVAAIPHLLVGHVAPLAILGLAGYLAGRFLGRGR